MDTHYDPMGRVSSFSLPYFEGLETARWVLYSYDPVGRVIRVTNPDNTYVTRSYLLGTTASVDANFHKREEDRDAYGRLATVREYTGTSPSFTLYATTKYVYDTLGNLGWVQDNTLHTPAIMIYDTLSRKTQMLDSDMGYWTYQYDANGNLTSQTDARNYAITFTYDALNRLTNKHYPTGPDVIYTYDELFSSNSKGRLTTVGDLSGTTKYHYDKLGRVLSTVKNVDGVDYTTDSTYDALGRTTGITYPDPGQETVSYTYDTGGNLQTVGGYATYSNYNALGQAGLVTFGNGDNTVYNYLPQNNRLYSLTTNSQLQGGLQNLSYAYDNVGNIQTITDLIDGTRTQTFQYDNLNRIAQAQSTVYGTLTYNFDAIGNMTYNSQVGFYSYLSTHPHAVVTAGSNSYSYDSNGNMTGRNSATLTYDYDNRLSSLVNGGTTTTFVYDAAGGRVQKTSSSITTLYIGKLYECTSGVCTKHIFAGGNRIVSKKPTGAYYYHTDHLGSSSVVTDNTGAKVEEIYYYPFGQSRVDSGSVNLHNKYTGQEQDGETGLYFYGARYYDPAIGRFVTADTIVPDPTNPQAFNRYSYVLNSPLIYIDPDGHGNFFRDLAKPFEHFGHWVQDHSKEIIITAAIIATVVAMQPQDTAALLTESTAAGAAESGTAGAVGSGIMVAGDNYMAVIGQVYTTSTTAATVSTSVNWETVGAAIWNASKVAAPYVGGAVAAGGAYYGASALSSGGGAGSGINTMSLGVTVNAGTGIGGGGGTFLNVGHNPGSDLLSGWSFSITGVAGAGAAGGSGYGLGVSFSLTNASDTNKLLGTFVEGGRGGLGRAGITYFQSPDGTIKGGNFSVSIRGAGKGYIGASFGGNTTSAMIEWIQGKGFSFGVTPDGAIIP